MLLEQRGLGEVVLHVLELDDGVVDAGDVGEGDPLAPAVAPADAPGPQRQAPLALRRPDRLLECLVQLDLGDRLAPGPDGAEGGLVHDVGQVGARQAVGPFGGGVEPDARIQALVRRVQGQDGEPSLGVGQLESD